jgi:hypothetical protein
MLTDLCLTSTVAPSADDINYRPREKRGQGARVSITDTGKHGDCGGQHRNGLAPPFLRGQERPEVGQRAAPARAA